MPPADTFVHHTHVRVRYAETDAMGVAHHAQYLVWFELARTDYLRACGRRYRDLEHEGVLLPVSDVSIRMMSPARYDDELDLACWITRVRSRTVTFAYEVAGGDEATLFARGNTTLICTGRDLRPRSIPPELVELLRAAG